MRFVHYLVRTLGFSLLCAAASLAFIFSAAAERRVALVVGNSAYRNVSPLANAANDAALISETLQSLGFELVGGSAQIDLDKQSFEAVIKRFGLLLQGAEVGLAYYAGHGVQVRGENYFVPVSANPEREADVDFELLSTALVMRQMEGAGTRLNLILLDACRNNPFGGRPLRTASRGLAQMTAPEGTLISFATQPGNVASDGKDGDSPYTKALVQTMKRPGLGVFEVFNEVGLEVKKQTGGAQQPWLSSSSITGSFYFSEAPSAEPIPPAAGLGPSQHLVPLATAPTLAPQALPLSLAPTPQPNEAQQVWATIQNTMSVAVLESYIKQFSSTRYGDIARARLAELKQNQASAPFAPPSSAPDPAPRGSSAVAPPHECSGRVGYVTGLDPQGDNNLSVRDAPHTPTGLGHEIDELFTGDSLCIAGSDGTWLRVQYIRSGTAKTGWVHSHYIRLVAPRTFTPESAPPGWATAAPPHECSGRVGYVTGLDPQGDNNLSVRDTPHAPKGLGHEIDELFTGDSVCIAGSDGTWLRVQYMRSGTAKTGWVHSHYIRLVGRGL